MLVRNSHRIMGALGVQCRCIKANVTIVTETLGESLWQQVVVLQCVCISGFCFSDIFDLIDSMLRFKRLAKYQGVLRRRPFPDSQQTFSSICFLLLFISCLSINSFPPSSHMFLSCPPSCHLPHLLLRSVRPLVSSTPPLLAVCYSC